MPYLQQIDEALGANSQPEAESILDEVVDLIAEHRPAEGAKPSIRQTVQVAFDQMLRPETRQLGRDTLARLCAVADAIEID